MLLPGGSHGGSHGTYCKPTFCPYLVGNKDRQQTLWLACGTFYMVHKSHTNPSILIGWHLYVVRISYLYVSYVDMMQSNSHCNLVLYQHTLWWCTMSLCTDYVVHMTICHVRYELSPRWCIMWCCQSRCQQSRDFWFQIKIGMNIAITAGTCQDVDFFYYHEDVGTCTRLDKCINEPATGEIIHRLLCF